MAVKTKTHTVLGSTQRPSPRRWSEEAAGWWTRPSQNVLKVQQLRVLAAFPQAV